MTLDSRLRPHPDPVPINPVWRLHRVTGNCVECNVRPTAWSLFALTVTLGSETFLSECYPDSPSAMKRATQIRDHLVRDGWRAGPRLVMS